VTKLYLRNTAAPAGTPTSEQSSALPNGTSRAHASAGSPLVLSTTKSGVNGSSRGITHDATTTHYDWLIGIWGYSLPVAQNIAANTWTIAIAAYEDNGAANTGHEFSLYVYRSGSGVIGYIYDAHAALAAGVTRELATTTPAAGIVGTVSGAAVTGVQAGDLLVLEVWHHVAQTMATAYISVPYFDGATEVTDGTALGAAAASSISTPQLLRVAYEQKAFRGRNDDGDQASATWKEAQDTNWSQEADQNFRVRFMVEEIGGAEAPFQPVFQLQYRKNGGAWTDVTGSSSNVRASASPNEADGTPTTQQLTGGTGTFRPCAFDEIDGASHVPGSNWAPGDPGEAEYCVQIRSADTVANDVIELRLVNTATGANAAAFTTYTKVPSITVAAASTSGTISNTLPVLTQVATATTALGGPVTNTLPALTTAATGTRDPNLAAVSNALPSLTQAATGTGQPEGNTGTVTSPLPSLTQAAIGANITVPQNLVAVAVDTDQIDLTWDEFLGASAYDIERDSNIIVFDHPTEAYSDIGLASDTLYTYRVRAVLLEVPEPPAAGLVGHYNFSLASSVFSDTARTTPATADGPIGGVTDLSGLGNHLTQATNGPTYKTGILNGLSVARFDGTNDFLTATALSTSQPMTLFFVLQKGSGINFRVVCDGLDASNNTTFYRANANNGWNLYAGTGLPDGTVTDAAFHIYSVVFNGASSALYEDGVSRVSGNAGTNGYLTGFRLGADRNGAGLYDGDVAEVLLYDRVLSDPELAQVLAYLQDRWGL
jgi:hypothetical protein